MDRKTKAVLAAALLGGGMGAWAHEAPVGCDPTPLVDYGIERFIAEGTEGRIDVQIYGSPSAHTTYLLEHLDGHVPPIHFSFVRGTGARWYKTYREAVPGRWALWVRKSSSAAMRRVCTHRHAVVPEPEPPEPEPPEPEPPEPEPPGACPVVDVSPFGTRWLVPLFPRNGVLRVANRAGDTSLDICAYDVNGDPVDCLLNEPLDAHEIGRWDRTGFAATAPFPWSLRITARTADGAEGVFATALVKPGGGGITMLPAVRTDR